MDMDDDFIGNIEFNLTPEQSEIVSGAIDLASEDEDSFSKTNPLIFIMNWWATQEPDSRKRRESPEETLAEACRCFILAHEKRNE
jgi:hypothetical protein